VSHQEPRLRAGAAASRGLASLRAAPRPNSGLAADAQYETAHATNRHGSSLQAHRAGPRRRSLGVSASTKGRGGSGTARETQASRLAARLRRLTRRRITLACYRNNDQATFDGIPRWPSAAHEGARCWSHGSRCCYSWAPRSARVMWSWSGSHTRQISVALPIIGHRKTGWLAVETILSTGPMRRTWQGAFVRSAGSVSDSGWAGTVANCERAPDSHLTSGIERHTL
jgi:hypothetical protein